MHPRKTEFIELFKASGWSQAELGRQTGFSRGGVNGLIKGDTVPSESALKLLKFAVAFSGKVKICPESGDKELESWRQRALAAEGELEKVRQVISPQKISSRTNSEGVHILARNFGERIQQREGKPRI